MIKHLPMKIRQQSLIDCLPHEVWPYVFSPEHFQKWNEKIVSMEVQGEFRLGHPFVTHYRWRQEQLQCLTQVERIEPNRLLELRHSSFVGSRVRSEMEVVERVTLSRRGSRTRVTKTVAMRNHGLPWLLAPLLWIISRFGKPVGEDHLKEMCENRKQASRRG
ncbi:MAG: SRPBCC family protein [Acidobacteriota bacterium]